MRESLTSYRFVIEGTCDPLFLASLVEDAKKLTSEHGGFTLSVGTHADVEISEEGTEWPERRK